MLSGDRIEPVVFLGGKDYVPLFQSVTESIRGTRNHLLQLRRDSGHAGLCLHALRDKDPNELALRGAPRR